MRYKNIKLEWNVLNHDFNHDKIIVINALSDDLKDDIISKVKKKEITNKNQLRDRLQRYFNWCYNSKSEYEFLMSGLFSDKQEKKNVYDQLIINIDHITEYINNALKLEF